MKRITFIIVAVSLSLLLAACASSTESSSATSSITDKPVASVEKSGESVTITYPSYMIPGANSDSTDTEKVTAAENFCKNILDSEGTLEAKANDDGSATVTMTSEAHEKLLLNFKASIDSQMEDFFSDGQSSEYSDYSYNDDLTVFTVNMDSNDYESPFTTAGMLFGISAEGYQVLNGVEEPHVVINYVDSKTEDTLGTLTYPDDYDQIFSDAENTLREAGELD